MYFILVSLNHCSYCKRKKSITDFVLHLLESEDMPVQPTQKLYSSPRLCLRTMMHFFLGSTCLLLFLQQAQSRTDGRTTCKPVTASFCQGLGYTSTPYPSGAQGFSLYQVGKMVETACSPHIATVLCRVVVPECGSENESQKKPCRALCDKVKRDCESTLRAKWLFWPSRLRCDSLPVSNCVQVS